MEIFREYIPTFMQVFLDYFAMYSRRMDHLDHLWMCLEKFRNPRLSLNPTKCVFGVTSGALLGHIVSKEGITVNLDKFKAILQAPTSTNTKALSRFLGQIQWHSRMLRNLADFATQLHVAVHRLPFQWMEQEDKAYPKLWLYNHPTCQNIFMYLWTHCHAFWRQIVVGVGWEPLRFWTRRRKNLR